MQDVAMAVLVIGVAALTVYLFYAVIHPERF
jgi:K+-transporting ATPase KdpF subunit